MLPTQWPVERQAIDDRARRRLFWRAVPPFLWPLAFCVTILNPRYFLLDRELIDFLARARTALEYEEELRDFSRDLRNRAWLRRCLRLRVSTRRLRALAREFGPSPMANA